MMYRPGVDENDVQMSDVLCDFCRRQWTEAMPFIEGHRGAMICGNCLSLAYDQVVNAGETTASSDYCCTMCRENDADRAALNRAGEPGWRSPMHEDAAVCRRCIKLAAGALEKDPDFDWQRPARSA
jgi:hypothetical protein